MDEKTFEGLEPGQHIYGLLGKKLDYSFSRQLHTLLGYAGGKCYRYLHIEAEPEELKGLLEKNEIRGLNVTYPYKKSVIAFCEYLSDGVLRAKAANTLVKKDGKLYAYNTDITGFRCMAYASGISFAGKKVLILGSGGASGAVGCALDELGVREWLSISRRGKNNYENLFLHKDAEIIINATPVGMYPDNGDRLLDLDDFPQLCGVLDIIYNPECTGLLFDAEKRGIPHLGGLYMLTAQAKASYELFTGKRLQDNIIHELVSAVRTDKENIILIGMPGCGKTTIGKILAEKLGRDFIDTDSEIENELGMSVAEIFRKQGEKRFRELEHSAVLSFGKLSGKVIAVGGGAVLNKANYEPLHQNGKIYFIHRMTELLATDGRPLSGSPQTLKEMQKIRLPLYLEFADAEIMNDTTAQAAADEILKRRSTR